MSETEVKIRGFVDPRTGEYVWATEANREQVLEAYGFINAWMFYWNGPPTSDGGFLFDRETWINSERRSTWLDALTDDQRAQLEDSFPPEEVPTLPSDD